MKVVENGTMRVVIANTEFQGKTYVDVRNYYVDKGGQLQPTRKGVMVPLDRVREVAEAMLAELSQTEKAETKRELPALYFFSPSRDGHASLHESLFHKSFDKARLETPGDYGVKRGGIFKTVDYKCTSNGQCHIATCTLLAVWDVDTRRWKRPAKKAQK
jgi:hypothetical protein